MKNILVISMAGIGDTILATPLIHELRANFPQARIDALVLWAGSKDILEGNPHLNHIYQRNLLKQTRLESLRFLLSVRKNRYDLSLNTHPQSRRAYRVIARIIGAPLRISHVYDSSGAADRLLVNRTLAQDYTRHSVDLNLDILRRLDKKPVLPGHQLELYLSPQDESWAASFLVSHQLQGRQILGLHAGSGGTKNLALKRWPLEQYIRLVATMRQARPDLAVLLFGGPDEESEIQKVLSANPSPLVIRVPSRSLREAGALMKLCSVFLSVDTALMHIAAAVKTPRQIVIEAFTLNKTNEPFGNPYTLIPNPAIAGRNLEYYKYDGLGIKGATEDLVRMMGAVTVDAVSNAIQKALGCAASH
ncbi:MAG TPA: glycosyltransferase family 9 protein [Verrucomicrobiae bacterium]